MISNLQLLHLPKCFWINDILVPTPSFWNWLLCTNGQSKQMLMIVCINALDIKAGTKIPNSLKCTWDNKGLILKKRNHKSHHFTIMLLNEYDGDIVFFNCCTNIHACLKNVWGLTTSIQVLWNHPTSMKEQCKSTNMLDLQIFSSYIRQVSYEVGQSPRTHVLVVHVNNWMMWWLVGDSHSWSKNRLEQCPGRFWT